MRLAFRSGYFVFAFICVFVHCELTPEDHVVLVAPVLAAPKSARARVTETAKDFPVLMLLATDDNQTKTEEPKGDGEPHPIYVQKLEDQQPILRRRRKLTSKLHLGNQ